MRSLLTLYSFKLGKNLGRKLQLAARVIVTIENPQDIIVQSARPYDQRAVLKFAQYTGAHSIAGRFLWRLQHNILASYLILAGVEWTAQPVAVAVAVEANGNERFALFESRDSPRELQKRRTSDIETSSRSGCSPFANAYRPSMPVLPRSCELLDWYGATVAYGTLQQGGRASRDFYNILIDEIVHVTKNGPLEDVVAGEIIVWEKSCTVFI
ncbi:hypothetical protein GIB67_042071 [Kingdonia uniflora]|uniref:Uncharacterized protein n=1 Tax=Kingdonia uniflora TaxID=39325 RepID=A0A7J7MW35_9MAGN|nr:hypothetical protein GIB67_042071 [Kingdonia uniflora]